jgi:hypothetical protein
MTGGCGRHKTYFDRIITMTDGKIQADSDPGTKNLPEPA